MIAWHSRIDFAKTSKLFLQSAHALSKRSSWKRRSFCLEWEKCRTSLLYLSVQYVQLETLVSTPLANYLQRKIDVREDESIAAGQSLCASSTVMDSSMLPMIAQHITLCKKSQFIHLPPLGIFSIHFVVEHIRINTISCHRHAEFRLIFRLFIHSFIQKEEI
ncbi:unnamed protein product [Albugo candida]|uniref:Uncharacterized protein n=1 Tax=Albugo candida TaxID=65357 RepID=A0A024GQI3_9STRA|nr:unnamed protein product [Albugo candida]|eukprot:CCI48623.1 unnamed protein product [Albugo candida]